MQRGQALAAVVRGACHPVLVRRAQLLGTDSRARDKFIVVCYIIDVGVVAARAVEDESAVAHPIVLVPRETIRRQVHFWNGVAARIERRHSRVRHTRGGNRESELVSPVYIRCVSGERSVKSNRSRAAHGMQRRSTGQLPIVRNVRISAHPRKIQRQLLDRNCREATSGELRIVLERCLKCCAVDDADRVREEPQNFQPSVAGDI
mmetsp:Transcript_19396/g.48005  ORF Transcript_19396/g.48005 Transcript_19396/m.48005 type:complete len:205 (+) Transcript_19396:4237-4851(+)